MDVRASFIPSTLYIKSSLESDYVATPIQELEEKLDIIWVENIVSYYSVFSSTQSDSFISAEANISDKKFNKIRQEIKTYSPKLGLVYMGETLGYGVFAREDIPSHVYITLYAGLYAEIMGDAKQHSNKYAVGLDDEENEMYATVCAEKYRNLGGFFQQLPAVGSHRIRKGHRLATENIHLKQFNYQNRPFLPFKTTRKILKDEIIGWDYSSQYWLNYKERPCLFYTNGKIMGAEICKSAKWLIRIYRNKGSAKHGKMFIEDFLELGELLALHEANVPFHMVARNEIYVIQTQHIIDKWNEHSQSPYMVFDKPDQVISIEYKKEDKDPQLEIVNNKMKSALDNVFMSYSTSYFIFKNDLEYLIQHFKVLYAAFIKRTEGSDHASIKTKLLTIALYQILIEKNSTRFRSGLARFVLESFEFQEDSVAYQALKINYKKTLYYLMKCMASGQVKEIDIAKALFKVDAKVEKEQACDMSTGDLSYQNLALLGAYFLRA